MRPSNPNVQPVPILMKETLVKYIVQTIAWFRRQFPNHPDFADLDPNDAQDGPDWWRQGMMEKVGKDIEAFQKRLDSDFTFGSTPTRPLYYRNSLNVLERGEGGPVEREMIAKIDLESILKGLFRKATKIGYAEQGPLQQRAWLSFLYNAVGRTMEIKFIDTNTWMYHPAFELLDTPWTETKTSTIQAMPMVPDKKHFLLCTYHSLGSFWAVEQGLMCSDKQESCASFLFPYLHGLKDTSISNKVLNVIRDQLPPGCPKKLKDCFSGKSIRQSTITILLLNRHLSYTDITGRSGHESGTELDTYGDKRCISTGLRAAKILAHYSDPDAETKVPKLDLLPSDSVKRLLGKVFAVSEMMSAFNSSGDLYIVIEICLASLIMHHNDVTASYGTHNTVATKLRESARSAAISDSRFPGEAPEVILAKWSTIVKDSFNSLNPDIARVTADDDVVKSLMKAINQQTQLMQYMNTKIDTLQSQVEEGKREREVERHRQEEVKHRQDQEMSRLYNLVSASWKLQTVLYKTNWR